MARTKTRFVITGIGMVTPLGNSYSDTVAALERGEIAKEVLVPIEGSGRSLRLVRIESFQAS